jgi:hypothetical protein
MNTASGTGAQGRPDDAEPVGQLLAEVLGLCDEVVALITDQRVEEQMRRVFDRLVREDLAAEMDAKTAGLAEETRDGPAVRDDIPAGTFHGYGGTSTSGADVPFAETAGRLGYR